MNGPARNYLLQMSLAFLGFSPIALGAGSAALSLSPVKDVTPAEVGIDFVAGSTSQIVVHREGRTYVVDAATHTVHEALSTPSADPPPASSSKQNSQQAQAAPAAAQTTISHKVYEPGDDLVFSVPTGRRLDQHGFYINFTHRFPYSAAFSGPARGAILDGLDDVAVSSFGFRFGITSKLSVAAYRSPTSSADLSNSWWPTI